MKRQLWIDSLPVTYAENGAGAPCVLVHGAGANRNYWRSLAAELANARTFVPDLYGHGETPPWSAGPAPRAPYAYGDDVVLLERLAQEIDGPFALIGHSSGGAVCLEYARRHPARVTKLVVAEPMLPGILARPYPAEHAEVAAAYERAHAAAARAEPEAAARCLFEYILGDGEWEKLPAGTRSWMTDNVEITLAAHSRASLALVVAPDDYAAIRCPVLVLCGERTRSPFRRICEVLAGALSDVRLAVVEGASHNAPVTHTERVNAAILGFLGERPSAVAESAPSQHRGKGGS